MLKPKSKPSQDQSLTTPQQIRTLAKGWYKKQPVKRRIIWRFLSEYDNSQQERVKALSAFLRKNNVTTSEVEALYEPALSEHARSHSLFCSLGSVAISIIASCLLTFTADLTNPIGSGAIALSYTVAAYILLQYPRRFNDWIFMLVSDIKITKANKIGLP